MKQNDLYTNIHLPSLYILEKQMRARPKHIKQVNILLNNTVHFHGPGAERDLRFGVINGTMQKEHVGSSQNATEGNYKFRQMTFRTMAGHWCGNGRCLYRNAHGTERPGINSCQNVDGLECSETPSVIILQTADECGAVGRSWYVLSFQWAKGAVNMDARNTYRRGGACWSQEYKPERQIVTKKRRFCYLY